MLTKVCLPVEVDDVMFNVPLPPGAARLNRSRVINWSERLSSFSTQFWVEGSPPYGTMLGKVKISGLSTDLTEETLSSKNNTGEEGLDWIKRSSLETALIPRLLLCCMIVSTFQKSSSSDVFAQLLQLQADSCFPRKQRLPLWKWPNALLIRSFIIQLTSAPSFGEKLVRAQRWHFIFWARTDTHAFPLCWWEGFPGVAWVDSLYAGIFSQRWTKLITYMQGYFPRCGLSW